MTDAQVFHAALEELLQRHSPFHPKAPECPNCYEVHTSFPEGCTAANLLAVCDITDAERNRILETLNPDAFWDAVGPILDDLQNGAFSTDLDDLRIASRGLQI